MLVPSNSPRIWLYNHPVDMRSQFDGLAALAKTTMKQSPTSGDFFVFLNRRRTMMKILYYQPGGYCLWSKRLERGCFAKQPELPLIGELSWARLQCLIEGIKWQEKHQNKRLN